MPGSCMVNGDQLFEQARLYLPKYLSPQKQQELWEGLRAFPQSPNYYSSEPGLSQQVLQGDGWHGFVVIRFESLEKKVVPGLVLSNSCDIDPANAHKFPPSVLFAPLVLLSRYCDVTSSFGGGLGTDYSTPRGNSGSDITCAGGLVSADRVGPAESL